MSILVKAIPAPKARTDETKVVSILYAIILVIMAVAQLFTFEEFLVHIQQLGLPLSETASYILGPVIVASEVFAIPFLLRMTLSPAFRYVSMFLGWFVAAIWLYVSFWLASTHSQLDTVGFLGTVGNLTPGWWAVFMSIALAILAAWSTWGLWPGKRTKK